MFCNIVVISCHKAKNRHFLQFSLLLPLFIHRVGTIFAYSGKEKSHAQAVHDFGKSFGCYSFVCPYSRGDWWFPLEGEDGKQGMDNLRFSSIAKRYATGISFTVRSKIAYRRSPRVRTPAAYFKAHSRPFATPFFRSPFMAWPNKSATALRENAPPGRFLIPQGGGKVRTPHGGSVQCGAPCCAGITDLQRGFWDNCESSTGFVQFRRSVRQYDLLLRC